MGLLTHDAFFPPDAALQGCVWALLKGWKRTRMAHMYVFNVQCVCSRCTGVLHVFRSFCFPYKFSIVVKKLLECLFSTKKWQKKSIILIIILVIQKTFKIKKKEAKEICQYLPSNSRETRKRMIFLCYINTVMCLCEWMWDLVSGAHVNLNKDKLQQKKHTNLPSFAKLHTITFLNRAETHEIYHTSIVCCKVSCNIKPSAVCVCSAWYSYTICSVSETSNGCYRSSAARLPWKTHSKVNQLTLLHQMCFPCMQLSSYHSNCIPEPNTHPWVIWHCLFDAPCVCVHAHDCGLFWCLEHITVGKPNLPAIVLIKAVFLRLSLDGRQHQLHKTTGTRRGRLPQPHWHPLWTSPDFKRYSLSDYRVTDWVKKRGKRESVSFKSPITKHWHFDAFETCAGVWKPAETGRQQQSGPIMEVDKKPPR